MVKVLHSATTQKTIYALAQKGFYSSVMDIVITVFTSCVMPKKSNPLILNSCYKTMQGLENRNVIFSHFCRV
jgi:hypothetical protein